jgi:biopolymer transport protein TolQ
MKRISKKFENHFWSGVTLDELHQQIDNFEEESFSITFKNVMDEYEKSLESKTKTDSSFIQRLETVLELSVSNEDSKLNKGLSFLASSGSVAPFIGLFGTVWGIMHSFQAIAIAQNTNLAVVAPGIAEALFVTALGLFVAIPSTAFYNLITAKIDIYLSEVENFGKDLVNIISRQIN